MNSFFSRLRVVLLIAILAFELQQTKHVNAQGCANADFEDGTLNGWTGTWGEQECDGTSFLGICTGDWIPNETDNAGFNQGPLNAATTTNFRHTIHSTGFDPVAGGTNLPMVHPSGNYSVRLGNATAEDNNGGETLTYSFVVDKSNANFTYHYAVVINAGSHSDEEQPGFKIEVFDGNNNPITCGFYDVNANSAATIGGFSDVGGNRLYKPWSSVFIPLNNYIGQTVTVVFQTADCRVSSGSHWTYAYIDAECAPLEIISSAPTICGGQTETLTAPSGAATYAWTGPGIVPPTGNQQVVSIDQAGAYSVTMTTFGNQPCTFSLDTILDPNASNPVASFDYTPVCVGNPVQFNDLSLPTGQIVNWAWDFDEDGTPDDITQNPSYTFPDAGTYPVRLAVTANPCVDDTIVDVVVLATPSSDFTVTGPVCAGDNSTITYTGNAPANATYAWDFDGGTIVSGSGQGPYEISWAAAGTKSVTLTVNLGSCSSPLTTNSVVVNALPTVDAGPDIFLCDGESASITATGATTYDWQPATGLSAATGASVTTTPLTTTTYTITGTSNGCVGTGTITVNVNPFPVVGVNPTQATVCAGETTTFAANGADTYSWSPATGLNATTGISVDATPLTTTTYTVTGTTNGCSADVTFDVTVNASPTLVVSPAVDLCGGQSTTMTVSGADSYVWSPATGLSSTTATSVDATPPVTTTYSVVGTALGCTSTETIDITVTPYPIVSISPDASSICLGDSKGFTASGADSYLWSPATGLSGTTGATVTANPTASTTYQVIGTINGCNDTAWADLTVNPIPVTTVSPDITICSGESTPLVASGATTYAWTPTTGLSSATGANVSANPLLTTNYTVTGTSLGCSSSAFVTVTVNQNPTVSVTPTQFAFCDGESVGLTASGATTYTWTPPLGLSTTTGGSVTANPTSTTTYTVVGSTLGCEDDATATITVYPNPVVDFTADEPSGCVEHCVNFTNLSSISNGTNSYAWDFGNGETANGVNQSICYPDTGVFTIQLTATSNNQCVTTLIEPNYISVYPNPEADFSVEPTYASVLNPQFQFTDNSNGAVEWYWNFGDGTTAENLITAPKHTYSTNIDSATYTVLLEVINQYGCVDETALDVYVTPHISLYVPNAFSPNGNDRNEVFRAYGENIVEFEMWIFNRWGQEIFYSANMEEGWDGTFMGAPVENDVYAYRILYRALDGSEGRPFGSVTLVR